MDAASEAARLGAKEVILAYRRTRADMPAYDFEYELAVSTGVRSIFNISPVKIFGNGKVEGVGFIKTKIENGSLNYLPDTEFKMNCDMVIKAHRLNMTFGLKLPGQTIDPDRGEAHRQKCLKALSLYALPMNES